MNRKTGKYIAHHKGTQRGGAVTNPPEKIWRTKL